MIIGDGTVSILMLCFSYQSRAFTVIGVSAVYITRHYDLESAGTRR
jgi:hypothetical protein